MLRMGNFHMQNETLDRAAASGEVMAKLSSIAKRPPSLKKLYEAKVMMVDDDPLICSSIRSWLGAGGFEVVIADGGLSGLRAVEEAVFDVMVVDIFMPGMNGFESIRAFHQRAPNRCP